ncbi:MAG: pilin [Candidatus Moranbacteria bacterium]|nr:pilin [Candidatus Moranbacteria bacterium]
MKSSRLYVIAFAIGIAVVVFGGQDAFAIDAASMPQYQQLENIPGYEGNKTFPEYVSSVYQLALWIIGISAMFMLTVGGFMYLTSAGNTSSASTAKGVIKDALIGLTLGLAAWLIVNTINPDLTTLNFSGVGTGTSSTPVNGGTAPVPSASAQQAASQIADGKLANGGDCKDTNGAAVSPQSNINEAKQGQSMTACFSGCNATSAACTGKVTPSAAMLSAISSVNGNYQITSIAGGSHAANSAHYSGNAFDVTPPSVALRDQFILKGALPNNPNGSGTFCEDVNGNYKADCVGADHIHVRF